MMHSLKHFAWSILLILCACSCAYSTRTDVQLNSDQTREMAELYSPWYEKTFCLGDDGVKNIIVGNILSAQLPLCDKNDVVFHTHPVFGEHFPNFIDEAAWKRYHKLYGNELYGILFSAESYKIYRVKEGGEK